MAKKSKYIIGTRGSLLAKTQTLWLVDRIHEECPEVEIEIVTIRTTGDIHVDGVLPQSLGKGLFTREIEQALLDKEIDFAVHSLKDLPTESPAGLVVGAIPEREDPSDALIGKLPDNNGGWSNITIGTASLRRSAQIKNIDPGCVVKGLRGNIDTRVRKVEEGLIDCAIVAAAGLKRVGMEDKISMIFDHKDILPAPGQGALGVEVRADDDSAKELLNTIHSPETELCVAAERSFLHQLGGGCRVPVAAFAEILDDEIRLTGRVISLDGATMYDGSLSGAPSQAKETGASLAGQLIKQGASEILDNICDEDFEGEFV